MGGTPRARVWHRSKKDKGQELPSDEKKVSESKFAGAKPMHFNADDDQPTREDREAAERKGSKVGFPT